MKPKQQNESQPIEIVEAVILERAAARAKVLGVAVRLDDPQVRRITRTYTREIHAEPIDDRVEMLTAAAVETLVSARPAAELAGVLRALRDLDCTDVRALAEVDRTMRAGAYFRSQYGGGDAERTAMGVAARQVLEASPHRLVLLGALLVAIEYEWRVSPKPAFLTPRGEAVLEVLRAWTATVVDAKAVA